ncbi:MAG TPA: response regulator transcription factor [Chitinophagaceae bacterium]|jgi:DNA-binding NarL/FixJ family response regulator|nr:response regulator transcription factor [Chitinophagaceae bacterium]
MKKISVVVVDDHQLVREMWAHIFAGDEKIEVIGESGEFEKAIEMIKLKRPDIVLLDINLPPASGLDAVPLIRKFSPGTKIIAVSMHSQPAYAKKMLRLGAKAYVTKNSSRQEIFRAVEEVMNGSIYICSEIKDNISDEMLKGELNQPTIKDLSLREIEIIRLIKNGLSSKEIAVALHISVRTAEVHRHNILKKLKLRNTASLITFINTTDLFSD